MAVKNMARPIIVIDFVSALPLRLSVHCLQIIINFQYIVLNPMLWHPTVFTHS